MFPAYSTAHHQLELPAHHPFPAYKYGGVARALQDELDVRPAPAIAFEALLLAHDPIYLRQLHGAGLSRQEAHKVGLPWSQALLSRAIHACGGTLAATRDALRWGLGLNLAGGTHHGYPNRAEGYCLFNDAAVAVANLRAEGYAGRILILDLDAHQGNGTAVFFAHDPSVFTFSMHAERNYPLKKEISDLDLGLPDQTGDAAYLWALEQALPQLSRFAPDLVFFNAGVDILANDRFGRLAVSLDGLAQRDLRVMNWVQQLGVPLVVMMGGGYNRDFQTTVMAHAQTYRLAVQILANRAV